MQPQQFREMLEKSGLPVTYRAWPVGEAPPLPWCAYYYTRSEIFAADGRVYYESPRYLVELYCVKKQPETERKLEAALTHCVWEKAESWLPDERMLVIIYDITI